MQEREAGQPGLRKHRGVAEVGRKRQLSPETAVRTRGEGRKSGNARRVKKFMPGFDGTLPKGNTYIEVHDDTRRDDRRIDSQKTSAEQPTLQRHRNGLGRTAKTTGTTRGLSHP